VASNRHKVGASSYNFMPM